MNEEDIERSPLEGMEAPPAPPSRDRVLADWQLRLVFDVAGRLGQPFGPLIRLLILTGQRLKELADADWSEFDRSEVLLRIPATRAKNRRARDVPLSDMVIAELDTIAGGKSWPVKGLVFTTNRRTPVSGLSKAKRHLDAGVHESALNEGERRDLRPWRYHDLRRTLATGCSAWASGLKVTEAILNHVSGSRGGGSPASTSATTGRTKRGLL